jgi:hypothetical protein
VNNQFERPSREAVVAYVQINNCICLKRLGKTTRDLSQPISRPRLEPGTIKIRTGNGTSTKFINL